MAEHRVGLGQFRGAAAHRRGMSVPERLRHLRQLRLAMRQEFVQRRVEQADGHRQPLHDAEQLDKILALERQQLRQRRAAAALRHSP